MPHAQGSSAFSFFEVAKANYELQHHKQFIHSWIFENIPNVKYGDRATQELDSGVLISTYHARPVGAYGASVALSSSLVDPNSLLLLLLLSQHLCCYELLH